jgi:hypothetical protein
MNKIYILLCMAFLFFSCIKKPIEEPIKNYETLQYEPVAYIQEEEKESVLEFMINSSYKNKIIYKDLFELGEIKINPLYNNKTKNKIFKPLLTYINDMPVIINCINEISIYAYKDEINSYKIILKDSPEINKSYIQYAFLEIIEPIYYQVEYKRNENEINYSCKKVPYIFIESGFVPVYDNCLEDLSTPPP